MDRPNNLEVKLTFFKPSGKYYTNGTARVNHFIFDDEYKQDIVNTQDALAEGWQGEFFVSVTCDDESMQFNECLFMPVSFDGIKKEEM